ncbi:DedA family protein [Sphingomonas bacterium]|uniref:DedA family protein n=1 Tax=Sphingomonas bacterium TaxID=1895847 RepID=UPI0015775722|nr:DedA family protein [Sphingomonas bacterium]
MTEKILAPIAAWIIAVISATGYLGVALLMAIESACIPLPSEIIMPFAGYLVSTGRFGLIAVATAGAIGCNLGSIIAYEVGKRGGRPFVERYGRYALLNLHDLDKAERFFARFGSVTVLVCRLLPVVRSFIAFPAGVARMPLLRFHIYTFLGSWPWCFALAWVGMKLGAAWRTDPRLGHILHYADAAVIVALVAGGIWFVLHQLKKRRA